MHLCMVRFTANQPLNRHSPDRNSLVLAYIRETKQKQHLKYCGTSKKSNRFISVWALVDHNTSSDTSSGHRFIHTEDVIDFTDQAISCWATIDETFPDMKKSAGNTFTYYSSVCQATIKGIVSEPVGKVLTIIPLHGFQHVHFQHLYHGCLTRELQCREQVQNLCFMKPEKWPWHSWIFLVLSLQ